MGKCKDCKWWDEDDSDAKDNDCGRGRCLKAVNLQEDDGKGLMVTLDASMYLSLLLTKPDFGCILFELKE